MYYSANGVNIFGIGKQARAYKREVNTAIEWKILKEWAFVGTKMTHGTFKLTINSQLNRISYHLVISFLYIRSNTWITIHFEVEKGKMLSLSSRIGSNTCLDASSCTYSSLSLSSLVCVNPLIIERICQRNLCPVGKFSTNAAKITPTTVNPILDDSSDANNRQSQSRVC